MLLFLYKCYYLLNIERKSELEKKTGMMKVVDSIKLTGEEVTKGRLKYLKKRDENVRSRSNEMNIRAK